MKKNKKAFTLIEILIAVAIIGVLAAIATPAYQGYALKGKISKLQVPMEAISGYLDSLIAEGKNIGSLNKIPATIIKPFRGNSLSNIEDTSGKYHITVSTDNNGNYDIKGKIDGYPGSELKISWNGTRLDKDASGKFNWIK